MLCITSFTNSRSRKFSKLYFQKLLGRVDLVLGQHTGNISVNIVDNYEIQRLNKEFCAKDVPTDVLAFAYHEGVQIPGEDLFGELFLAPDIIKKQAPDSGNTFEEELCFIFIHGVLHLLGYDHQTRSDEKQMHELTNEILQDIRYPKI